jgi:hypothetical protein
MTEFQVGDKTRVSLHIESVPPGKNVCVLESRSRRTSAITSDDNNAESRGIKAHENPTEGLPVSSPDNPSIRERFQSCQGILRTIQ